MLIENFVFFCYNILSPKLLELCSYLQTDVLYAQNSKTVHTQVFSAHLTVICCFSACYCYV